MFIDRVRVRLQAGNGGAGVSSFIRSRRSPKGKAVGGSGGPGGDVILVASKDVVTLLRYRRQPHSKAGAGVHGRGDLQHGKVGETLVLPVPLGTVVYDDDGTLLADLVEEGQQVTVLTGGRGGRGNAAFVSPQHRSPSFAEQGEYGPAEWFTLELKLLADAALIGFPNAGKSTLISRVSAARPKIADYPFTTLEPNLGVVAVSDREFTLADIPGLIEGASEGKGLGHDFLRHTERARALVVLLDPAITQEVPPTEQLRILLNELEQHSPDLVSRPRVVALGKADLPSANDDVLDGEIMRVSSVTGEGLTELMHAVADAVDEAKKLAPEREGYELHRPLPPPFTITREGEVWVVEGRSATRAVALDDLTQPEAARFAAGRLERLGVDHELAVLGAIEGDTVRIGDIEFEYLPPVDDED